jgi:hypothetical protein
MNPIVASLIGLSQLFFGSNPLVEEIDTVLPALSSAIASAKAGQAFSVSIPLSVDAVKGNWSFSWSPGAA